MALNLALFSFLYCGYGSKINEASISNVTAVILLPLRPVSLTPKNPQRGKIIHEMRPIRRKERLIDLKLFWWNILFV